MFKNIKQKSIIILFIVSFIFISSFSNISIINAKQEFHTNVLHVGGNGPGNYTSIQKAIDNSFDGYTIIVYEKSSPYKENIVIDKSITLLGE